MKPLNDTTKGVVYGLGAYTLWGSFPLYFALFKGIPSWEVLIHRVIWSCLFLAVVISILKRWPPVVAALRQPRRLGHVLQASLGYFLTPLVNVAMGLLILGERISRLQAAAVGLAAVAILYQLLLLGELPWITLVLAFSFGTYGLMRKKVELDGLSGLFVETLLLLPLGLLTLAWLSSQGLSHFSDSTYSALLLASSGAVTAIPLLAFAGAARRSKLSTVGFLMYINPTIQFLIALYIFHEPLSTAKLVSFVMIWVALAIYSWSAWVGRSNREASA